MTVATLIHKLKQMPQASKVQLAYKVSGEYSDDSYTAYLPLDEVRAHRDKVTLA